MTGGWGTRLTPQQREREEQRLAAKARMRADYERKRAALLANVLTGACGDGLHENCQGHLLGVPCCCTCHKEAAE